MEPGASFKLCIKATQIHPSGGSPQSEEVTEEHGPEDKPVRKQHIQTKHAQKSLSLRQRYKILTGENKKN